jgi:4-hydroxy-4-methyl-2-oxoglutarate aldolase
MTGFVIRNIQRAAPDSVEKLGDYGVATVHESQARTGLMKTYMRPVWEGARAAGPAVTVLAHPGDNWMLHVAVEQCRPGDMLVVACSSDNADGMFGELLATSLRARGVVGLVIDAGCRDVRDLKAMGFPVWARAISAKGTVKESVGSVNVPVICAGVRVRPGDVVVGDDDGVVVVPARGAPEVVELAELRVTNEEEKRRRLAAGELGLDLYGMRHKLERSGLIYLDHLPLGMED